MHPLAGSEEELLDAGSDLIELTLDAELGREDVLDVELETGAGDSAALFALLSLPQLLSRPTNRVDSNRVCSFIGLSF